DRLEIRRHEKYRRSLGRFDHGGADAAAVRREDAVGTSRHRRHRARPAAERHQQELEVPAGAGPARPAGAGFFRTLGGPTPNIFRANTSKTHDRDPVLSPQGTAARTGAAATAAEVAGARLAGRGASLVRGTDRGARRPSVELA